MLAATPTQAAQASAPVSALRLALVAPPTVTVPPASLGGLDQVRWLAQGLAARGHQVALIGADLGGLAAGGYQIIDTDPTGGERASPEIIDRLHAEQAGTAIERLGRVDGTVQTSYRPLVGLWEPPPRVAGHLGWVALSAHQQRNAPTMPWVQVVHPAIPIGEHQLSPRHSGACVYLGPLLERHGAGLALQAAHAADVPVVLAGTHPGARATAYTEVELRPRLASADVLLETVSPLERWDLLANAYCLVAPLHPDLPYSLEIVEAMAYGTPVVTMVTTVGAELVCHGVSGLVLDDPAVVAEAVSKAGGLDPALVREHAASRFDLPAMVDGYQRLFVRLVAPGAGGR